MDNKEKLIDKIRKLLALSASPNENEASLAAEKAQALCAVYNLSLADIGDANSKKASDVFITDMEIKTDSVPWRRQIAHMVAKMYFCTYFVQFHKERTTSRSCGYIRYDYHAFVGTEANVVIAKMMFEYLAKTTERLADEGAGRYPMKERSAYKTSFKMACALRLGSRIAKKIEEAKAGQLKGEGGSNLPALLDLYESTQKRLKEHLQENVGPMKKNRSVKLGDHAGGIKDGDAAGKDIGLDPQVERGRQAALPSQ